MRKELEQIKQIESYLNNSLTVEEKKSFEIELQNNPDLNEKVDFQRGLVKKLRRGAMLVALEKQHVNWANGSTGTTSATQISKGLKLSILNNLNTILIIAGLGAVGIVALIWSKANNAEVEKNSIIQKNSIIPAVITKEQNNGNGAWEYHNSVAFTADNYSRPEKDNNHRFISEEEKESDSIKSVIQTSALALEKRPTNFKQLSDPKLPYYRVDPIIGDTIVDSASGTKIIIPANAFRYKYNTKALVTEPIKFNYKEYRTKGDMVLSSIPMHWFGLDSMPFRFHSEGMFSITAMADSGAVILAKPLKVEFTPINLIDSLNFFYLADTTSKWQFVQTVPLPKQKIDSNLIKERQDFINEAKRTGFGGETKPNWAEPRFSENGNAYRYGFWGRLVEYLSKGTVYGVDSVSFKRVFTARRELNSSTFYDDDELNQKGSAKISEPKAQSITIKKLGYYNYDKLLKNPNAIRPIIKAYDVNGEYIKGLYKIVAVEEGTNAAYHFYNRRLCLHSAKTYDFFAFTTDGKILFASKSKYKKGKSATELKLNFVDVTGIINSAKDVDELLEQPTMVSVNSLL